MAYIALVAMLVLQFVWPPFAPAQIPTAIAPTTGPGSLGTTITTNGHTVQITGGARPNNGTNLFHSFNQFDVGSADTALFLNTTPSLRTDNILSRVTGGSPSSIFGAIDTMSYPGTNLFFMNPAGIVFGSNAILNVGGSVTFTTADHIRLADANGSNAGIFHTDPTATSLLTSASVTAFGFLGANPSAILVQGTEKSELRVQPARSISLVGGNKGFTYTDPDTGVSISVQDGVTITSGHLLAPGGQINIASAASPGEFLAGTLDQTPNINGQSFGTLGTVQVLKQSSIDTTGKGNGTILIRGGRLVVNDSTISSSTGDISFYATSLLITHAAEIYTATETAANAGHITLMASGDIDLKSSAIVDSSSMGDSGNGGNITLSSSHGNINLIDRATVTSQTDTSRGNPGNIAIEAVRGDILLARSSIFNTADGTGSLGGIQVKAYNLHLRESSSIGGDNFSPQAPGNIAITLDGQLKLAGGSFINTQAFGSADSADLTIRAPYVLITGKESSGTQNSGLFTGTVSSGDGGQLSLFTDNLQLADGGILSSRSFIGSKGIIPSGSGGVINVHGLKNSGVSITIDGPGSGILTSADGIGAAGDIVMNAKSVILQNGGAISASTAGTDQRATGGSITVNATDQVALTNGASITASSTGPADAGSIFINAGQQLDLTNGSSITTTTQSRQANGGNIDIRAIDRVRLVDSTISTSVKGAEGSGGNIFIDPKVVMLEGSNVTAQAVGGSGGNITFVTPLFLQDSASTVSATSQRGISGTVLIQSPTSNLSGTVGQLASKTNPPQVLLQNRCVALAGGEQSTFILAGRDALPSEPGGWLSSPVAMEHWTGEEKEHASGLMVRSLGSNGLSGMAALQDKSHVLSMRRLTPPGFLVRSFATGTTGCPS